MKEVLKDFQHTKEVKKGTGYNAFDLPLYFTKFSWKI